MHPSISRYRNPSVFLLITAWLLVAGHCVYAPDHAMKLSATDQPITFKGTGNLGDEIVIQATNYAEPTAWDDVGGPCFVPEGGFWSCTRVMPQTWDKWYGPAFGTGGYWIDTRVLRNGAHMPSDESDPYVGTMALVCNPPSCELNLQ